MELIGKLFAERYEILAEIGSGGMAKVYKARDTVLGRFVAIKILRAEFLGDEEFTMRFVTEARAAAGLSHQNLVSIYDVGNTLGNNFIVMEYVDGITLKEHIKQQKMLSWQETVSISVQILQGIAHAHEKGIIHRDIKPQNIMIAAGGLVKVMDFGIARATSAYTMKIGDTTIGSVHYFSPEQARGRHTDERSDIYSLGIVMYEMLTGKVPFDGDSPISVAMMHLQHTPKPPKEFNLSVPLAIEDIVMKSILKDTTERYQTAHQMLSDLFAAQKNPDVSPVADAEPKTPSDTRIMQPVFAAPRRIEAVLTPNPPNDDDDNPLSRPPEAYVPKSRKLRKEQEKKRAAGKAIAAAARGDTNEISEKNKKLTTWAWAAGGFIVLAFAFLVTLAMFPNLFRSSNYEDVPVLVGQSISDVLQMYTDSDKVKVTVESRRFDNEAAKDIILEQTPASGKKVKTPIEISVIVSDGARSFILPNFVGKDERTVVASLEELEIEAEFVQESSATVPEGLVIKTSPEGGTTMKSTDKLVITVSRGSNGIDVKMPNLVGLSRDDARRLLEQYNLIGNFKYEDSDKAADIVLRQSVEKDATIKEFSEVDVWVSSGKTPAPTQPPQKSRTISITVPQDKETTLIRVLAGGQQIHNANHNKSEGSFNLTVYGTGDKVRVEVYRDGVLTTINDVTLQ